MQPAGPQTSRQVLPETGADAPGLQSPLTERSIERLAGQLGELGLSVSFWDPAGAAMAGPGRGGEGPGQTVPPGAIRGFGSGLCRQMCGQRRFCLEAMGRSARSVCREGRSEVSRSPSGCCMLAVPVRRRPHLQGQDARRRVSMPPVGSAVACFPTLETPQTEEFARACSQARLDAEAMAALCRQEARHTDRQAECLCKVVEWMIRDEQAKEAARDELATLSTNLANTYEELSLLYDISGSMKVTQDTMEFLRDLCRELLEVMGVQSAAVVLHPREHGGKEGQTLDSGSRIESRSASSDKVVHAGELPVSCEQLARISRQYIFPRASAEGQGRRRRRDVLGASGSGAPVVIDNRFSAHSQSLGPGAGQIRTIVAAPLMISNQYGGALVGLNKLDGEFDSTDLKLISSVSSHVVVFLKNHHLYEDLQDLLMGVLHALTASIDAKDPYTCGHSHRVALVSRKLAQLLGFDEQHVGRVYLAGLLHDIGKIGIPESVLQKTGKLTASEFDTIKLHPGIGATIMSGIRQMEDLIPVILHHHERIDGRGYPRGLSGKDIPIEALIVGLADSFDAMTSFRTYRTGMPLEAVIAEIHRCSGTQFDPTLAELLLSLDLEEFLTQIRADETNDANVLANSSASV